MHRILREPLLHFVLLGGLLFVGAVLLLVRIPAMFRLPVPAWWPQVAAYAIGSVAMFWVIERVGSFSA